MNMSYCRYRNTLNDLNDCFEQMDIEYSEDGEDDLSIEESRAKENLIELCAQITDQFNDEYEVEDAEWKSLK